MLFKRFLEIRVVKSRNLSVAFKKEIEESELTSLCLESTKHEHFYKISSDHGFSYPDTQTMPSYIWQPV